MIGQIFMLVPVDPANLPAGAIPVHVEQPKVRRRSTGRRNTSRRTTARQTPASTTPEVIQFANGSVERARCMALTRGDLPPVRVSHPTQEGGMSGPKTVTSTSRCGKKVYFAYPTGQGWRRYWKWADKCVLLDAA